MEFFFVPTSQYTGNFARASEAAFRRWRPKSVSALESRTSPRWGRPFFRGSGISYAGNKFRCKVPSHDTASLSFFGASQAYSFIQKHLGTETPMKLKFSINQLRSDFFQRLN